MAFILCTGTDPLLIATQRLMLERVGHQIVCAVSETDVEKACAEHHFDVAVIGQSLSSKVKLRFLTLVRKHCPAAAILEVYPQYSDHGLADADAWLPMPIAPEKFIDTVNSLARKQH